MGEKIKFHEYVIISNDFNTTITIVLQIIIGIILLDTPEYMNELY